MKFGAYYGRCSQCGGLMFVRLDFEKRKLTVCQDCGAQLPLQDGLHLTGKSQNKTQEKSFPDK